MEAQVEAATQLAGGNGSWLQFHQLLSESKQQAKAAKKEAEKERTKLQEQLNTALEKVGPTSCTANIDFVCAVAD